MTETAAEIDRLIGEGPRRVWIERRSDPGTRQLAVVGAGLAGLLLVLMVNSLNPGDLLWLVCLPMAAMFFGTWARGPARQRWAMVVELADGNQRAFLSEDRVALDQTASLIRVRCADPAEVAAPAPERLGFLDGARALAIVVMVFAHVTDQLLSPALQAGPLGVAYLATRGFTGPLFFVLSGWAFAASLLPRAGAGQADFPRRLRRGGVLLLWGYLLTLPYWADGFPFTDSTAVWIPFWSIGVLQNLGVCLLIATGLLWWVRVPSVFIALCVVAAVLAVAVDGPAAAMAAHWHPAARGFFDPQNAFGGFPLTPWSAYFFAGAALGGAFWLRRARPLQISGALLAVAGLAWLGHRALVGFDALLVWRFAGVAAVLGVAAIATARARLPAGVRILGQHALAFYVGHMVLLWGAPKIPGLVYRLGKRLDWLSCVGVTIGCLAVISAGLWVAPRLRARLVQLKAQRGAKV